MKSWRAFKQSMVNLTASYSPKHAVLKALSKFWNLSTSFSWNSMLSCSVYLWESLMKNKGRVELFQISQTEGLFYLLWSWNVLEDNLTMWFHALLAPSKKGLSLPFSLAKNRIYLDTQLNREPTDLFWKLIGCSLFLQVE